ncbi:hypothetical protein BVC80_1321g37 [Macleaya cordata]|uniref:Uncharacterized protein n=1 Tax=Macleaya cordata TaxID=56857 RepID=A0A200Q092_MACCD|nr:hypothetical protein BVC80_1321g37 [Macleaya cordata]
MEKSTVASAINGSCHSQRRNVFHGNIEIEPASVSCSTNNIPPKPNLREPSFSSYLRPPPPPPPPQPNKPVEVARELFDENEISIFKAEKYFNETQQQHKEQKLRPPSSFTHITNTSNLGRIVVRDEYVKPPLQRNSSVSSSVDGYGYGYGYGYGRNNRTRSVRSTPTISSEASWNSQSGLLSNPPPGSVNTVSVRNINLPSEQKKKSGSPAKWLFGRKCCFGKKSIQVDENLSEPTKTHHQLHLISNNPTLNPKKQRPKAGKFGLDKAPPLNEKTEQFEKSIGIEQRAKSEFLTENWAKDHEVVHHSARFTPENMFPAIEIGRRVDPSGRSFGDVSGFSFPVLLNPIVTGKPLSQLTDSTRESLESLRLSEDAVKRKSMEIQRRRLVSLSLDHDHRIFNIPVSPRTRATTKDEDVASDTSSDLFEIESFSTQTSYPTTYQQRDYNYNYLEEEISNYKAGRRSLDEPMTPSVAPTEFYEPSEASIDWSVTTAEGFDRASFANFSIGPASSSDYEETKFVIPSNGNTSGGCGGGGKMRGNGLLGCRENAVKVGPNPEKHVVEPDKFCDYAPSFRVETNRVEAMSRLANISSMHPTRASITKSPLPLARSRSARMYSHALATH